MRRTILFFLALVSLTVAGQGVKPLPKLHVEGRWLVDNHGNHVVLHGVMDTPSMFFNNERWGSMYLTNNDDYSREGATAIVGVQASPTAASGSHVYDMSGRRVSSTGSLMPGVYIMDGKKIVVR
jgi:hypothetical protein